MAEFVSIDKNKYKIIGILTEEDINKINSFKNSTTIILENTVGLSSELVSKISSDLVTISITGGLDGEKKKKFNTDEYYDRTLVSPVGLVNILKYFEYNEKMIDSSWNDMEKAMFLYNCLVEDMLYIEDLPLGDRILKNGITERSLNGILYGKLTCSGLALVYKEMLDRIGVKSYYQNQKHKHSFNIIEINDKRYGVDVTWDNYNAKKYNKGKCFFGFFGQDPDFYFKNGHRIQEDPEEEMFDLSIISKEELDKCKNHIDSKMKSRQQYQPLNLATQPIITQVTNLPLNKVSRMIEIENPTFITLVYFLKKRDALQIDSQLANAIMPRIGYLRDMGSAHIPMKKFLSENGIHNFTISEDGTVVIKNENAEIMDQLTGIDELRNNISKEQLLPIFDSLNKLLTEQLNKYILNIIKNLDILLANYEYKPDEWDTEREIENANIYSKLEIIVHSRDYLIKLGLSQEEVDAIIQRITSKYNEIHKPYEKNINQKDHDLDFLTAVFEDLKMVWQTIEYDLQKKITEEEFISLYSNVDYMIQLYEKYITIAGDKKFKFSEYNISKTDLQQLLNNIIQDYQKNKLDGVEKRQNQEIHR